MVHSHQVHQGRGRGHRGHPAAGRRPRPGHDLCGSHSGRWRLRHKLPWSTRSSAAAAAFWFLHALGARAELDEYVLFVPIGALLRASWWHLPQFVWRPVLALWCVYQSA